MPDSITRALDLGDLHGPEVDLACNAEEPEVDQWEAGERYPRWDQLVALSRLTGFRGDWFTTAREPLAPWATSMWFHMSEPDRRYLERTWNPIMRFPRAVIEAAALDQAPPDPPEDRSA